MRTVYFDLETAGLEETRPIIQLAAVAVDESTWQELAAFEAKLTFDAAAADPEALRINHYDPALWAEVGMSPARAAAKFSDFIRPYRDLEMISKRTGQPYTVARLAGHNASTFDGPRLRRLFEQQGLFLGADPRVRCTLQRATWWFDERGMKPPSYKLEALCRYFEIQIEQTHDALADVRLTVQLARALREAK